MNRLALCAALAFPVVAYVVVATLGRPGYDIDYFEYIGWAISRGSELYRDIWDCKGPLLYYWYALGQSLLPGVFPAFGSAGVVLSLVLWEMAILMVYRLARLDCENGRAGFYSLLFVVLALGSGTWIWIGCQEILAAFLALTALWSLVDADGGGLDVDADLGRASRWKCACLGACVAAAFMVKATCAAFGGAVLVLWILQVAYTRNWRRLLCQLAFSFVGFSAAFVGIAVMCSGWDWERMIDASILYNIMDRGQDGETWCVFWWTKLLELVRGDVMWYLRFGWNYPFFLVLFALTFALRPARGMVFFRTWLVLELVVSVCSKGFFDHYLIISVVPLVLLFASSPFRSVWSRNVFRTVVVVFFLVSFGRTTFYYGRYLLFERWDWTAITASIDTVRRGTRVAVYGGPAIHVLLKEWDLLNRNTYSAWSFWFESCSERRKAAILDDFERAVTSRENEWILSECPIEGIQSVVALRSERLRSELEKYELYNALKNPRVYFYKRK